MPKRYHPTLAVLHWLLAALILLNLVVGDSLLRPLPNSDPDKLRLLLVHKSTGMLIAALTLIRLAVRLRTKRPHTRPLTTALHLSLYALVLLMPLTGMVMALSAHLNAIVFQGKGTLPATLANTQGHLPHIIAAILLAAAIAAHIAMIFPAKITLKGDPMPRMWLR